MILIAESGSTKTDWCLIDEGQSFFETKGLNPLFVDANFVLSELDGVDELKDPDAVQKVVFFGAGLSTPNLKGFIESTLQRIFTNAEIQVYSDLEASARALYRSNPVIACILGTGSNACYFDGDQLQQSSPSLGFILGDEASGAWFGKELLRDYLYNKVPDILYSELNGLNITKEVVIERVYRSERPNQFLASFFPLIVEYRSEEYCQELIRRGLNLFVDQHVNKYPADAEISFVGGVAKALESDIMDFLQEKGLQFGQIIPRPLDVLIEKVDGF